MEEAFADPRNPAAMTPHERRQEIGAILAWGVLRLRRAAQASPESGGSSSSRTPENPAKQRQNGLDGGGQNEPSCARTIGTART
jgi:hypothetical protein